MTRYTVYGSTGFIGRALVDRLRTIPNASVITPRRDENPDRNFDYGHVFYCIGLTSDFRTRPFETVEAHVSKLSSILKTTNFQSFIYFSSTRVYQKVQSDVVSEDSVLKVSPSDSGDLYNISKLMGESLCLSIDNRNVKVVRLSNVVGYDPGSDNFVSSLIKTGIRTGELSLETNIDSSKDYIYIDDLIELLVKMPSGNERLYNIASGVNTSTKKLIDLLRNIFPLRVIENSDLPTFSFPLISVKRAQSEFSFEASPMTKYLRNVAEKYSENIYR